MSDEEAEEWARNDQEWKAKQPEWIWEEMTNEEIVKDFNLKYSIRKERLDFYMTVYDLGEHRIINGKLYKKIKNPYIRYREVISADDG